MNENSKSKLNADQFFQEQRIHATDIGMPTSKFTDSLRDTLHSKYLLINDEESSPKTLMDKIKFLLSNKVAIGALSLFVAVIIFSGVAFLTVPSLKDKLNPAHQNQEKNTQEQPKNDITSEPDTKAPELTITSPQDGFVTTDPAIKVSGTTESGVKITMQDAPVYNDNGKFIADVALQNGQNVITVVVTDGAGNQSVKKITVTKNAPAPTPTPKPAATSKITLSGGAVSGGIKFSWSVSNVDTSNGFKLVRSTSTSTPVYPGNDYVYLDNGATRSYTFDLQDGQTYWFRICNYTGSGCGTYSNSVKITAPSGSSSGVSSITVSGSGTNINWTVNGYSSMGFKLVWSKNSGPTYPTRAGDQYEYYSDPSTTSGSIYSFDGTGTYYVRVCEYLGGSCGKYSNQITVTLP